LNGLSDCSTERRGEASGRDAVANLCVPASLSNPAFGILPAAFALARDAIQRIAQTLALSPR
jgi:hypothetical protein